MENNLSKNAIINVTKWLNEPKYAVYKPELETLINGGKWAELEDAFFQVIEFGTAGSRGITGIGSNRINRVTIGEFAQALCEYALSADESAAKKGIVIGFDTRLSSPELSRVAAEVVAANGFKTYIFDSFRATPELSFAVRHLGCSAGIVISASHNPPADNGFKAYWSDGAQLVPPHDKGVMMAAAKVADIKSIDYNEAIADGKITEIGSDIDEAYIKTVLLESVGDDRDVSIVYSPLHGAGQTSVLPVLRAAGFKKISLVEPQMTPDGNFPTIPSGKPNPEELSSNDMAVAELLAKSSDIAVTNDPDADRLRVTVRKGDRPVYLNGNQTAILATDYCLNQMKLRDELTPEHYIAKTIVTTDMLNSLAQHYGVKIYDNLLIGFKYIGELIKKKEVTAEKFVIGCEESYGLLKGTYARDKDAAVGVMLLAEYAAELKKLGKDLYDRLIEIYQEHGLYFEKQITMVCPGSAGFKQMERIMEGLRKNPPERAGDDKITAILDYETLTRLDTKSGKITPIDCIKGNVVVLEFGDSRNRVTIRPSGTEPKIRLYAQWFEGYDSSILTSLQYDNLEKMIDIKISGLESALARI